MSGETQSSIIWLPGQRGGRKARRETGRKKKSESQTSNGKKRENKKIRKIYIKKERAGERQVRKWRKK